MFKIHTKNGLTSEIDLKDNNVVKEWNDRFIDPAFQKTITGISFFKKCGSAFKCTNCKKNTQYSLSRPDGFGNISLAYEVIEPNKESKIKGGNKIICIADDVKITFMIHGDQQAANVSITKVKGN